MKKFLMFLLLLPLSAVAASYDIEYQRVYNKIKAEDNVLSMKVTAEGQVSIHYPSFNSQLEKKVTSQLKPLQFNVDSMIEGLLAKKTNPSLERKLKVIKSDRSQARFYSSEVDQFTLIISKNGQELWNYSFYNFEELKHYYSQLGEWQPLVDLVNQVQQVVLEINQLSDKEVVQ